MLKFFTSDLRRNLTKLFCLTIGLAIGLLLVAKAFMEDSYDRFIPESENVYIVTESIVNAGEFAEYAQTPGAIAPGLKRYVPQVEDATRIVYMSGGLNVRTPDNRLIESEGLWLADSCFFRLLRQPVVSGDAEEALSVARHCMIPRSLAEKICGDVIGMELTSPDVNDSYKVIVDGIYEDFPVNSSFRNAIYLSLASIKDFFYDGRENWLGNDSYQSYVRLAKGTEPDDIRGGIDRMLKENLPKEAIEVFHFNIGVKPLVGLYTSQESVKTSIWVLSILAFIILVSASLNYLLIVIGQLGKRSKEMAVRKCYGEGNGRIFLRIMGESFFFLLVSVLLAVLIVFCLSDQCEMLLGYPASVLLTCRNVWLVELCVCLVLLVITGVIPAWIYCRTPVSHAFRHNSEKRRVWKLVLLAVQFFATGLLFCLLTLVFRQYRMMSRSDMGFDYENVAFVYVKGLEKNRISTAMEEMSRLGCVEGVSSADQNFTLGASGNNVFMRDDPRQDNVVNVADMYFANADVFDLLGMKFIQGGTFTENADSTVNEVIVEERFIDVLKEHFGQKDDNVIGKRFCITEHSDTKADEFTICGVIGNMRRGGYYNEDADRRAGVIFPSKRPRSIIYVKFGNLTPENLKKAQDILSANTGDNYYLMPLRGEVEAMTAPAKRFGFSVMAAGVAILLIAIIGLIGYTADEVQRRAREIAIRKVNGTTVAGILKLFCFDVMKVAVPSLLAGGAVAMIIGRDWLAQFTDRVSLSPLTMTLALLLIFALIMLVVVLNSLKVARSNPVEYLRNE